MRNLMHPKNSINFTIIALSSFLPVITFFQQNVSEVRLSYERGLYYFLCLFFVITVVTFLSKAIFKKVTWTQLSFTVSLLFVALFHLFVLNHHLVEYLGSNYRIRYFAGLALITIFLIFAIGLMLSKRAVFQNFITTSMGIYIAILSFQLAMQIPFSILSQEKPSPINKRTQLENVYYIIPDAMLGPEMYEKMYKKKLFFASYLENNGFILNRPAFSNGPVTLLSIPNVLNMEYILKDGQVLTVKDWYKIGDIFKGKNNVYKAFHDLGYKITAIGDGYVSHCSGYADECIHNTSLLNRQDLAFLDRTQILTLAEYFQSSLNLFQPNQLKYPRALEVDHIMPRLKIKEKDSSLTILHIGLPHYPYRFKADCTTYNGDAIQPGHNKVIAYDQQLECAQKKFQVLIDQIIEKDPNAIMLVQSDHGTIFDSQGFKPNKDLSEKDILESFNIISAYKLPKQCQFEVKGEAISPVNSFKVILSCLKNEQVQLLPHQSFIAFYLDWPAGQSPVQSVNPYPLYLKENS